MQRGISSSRPAWWPRFRSTLRSTAVTARLGRMVGIAIGICFLTGLLSFFQYQTWEWLPPPATPVWGYRLTQGIHVATGTATIPLVMVKLWSVYPNAFRWPPFPSPKRALERGSVALLVSATLVQLTTGFLNVLGWRPFAWDFLTVHYFLAYVVVGSVLLHVAVKLPDIRYGLQTRVADGDVLTEIPWSENPVSHSNAGQLPPPITPGLSRRGVLAVTGAGIGVIVLTSVGQTVTPLEPVGLLAARQPRKGPLGVPVDRTAAEANVIAAATAPDWTLRVAGPRPYELSLADIEQLAEHEARLPLGAPEGWGVDVHWRGVRLLDVVVSAGGTADSHVRVSSLEAATPYNRPVIFGPQLLRALLATHLNGERLSLDHGYPVRLVVPNRSSALNIKWVAMIEVLP
ncbi:MAG TPA: molybdopterin-dependent oxidoreductase [Propionibacteriaceae bacterium]|nr:molybdopterin-dependent oxidoreductase [Propionibacteriaceae bacterium]